MSHADLERIRYLGKWFTGIRRQGLLALVPPDAWHTLSAVLSFTTREGARRFSLDQLAGALGLSRDEARRRISTLAQIAWRDALLLAVDVDPEGEQYDVRVAPIEGLTDIEPAEPDLDAADAVPSLDPDLLQQLAQVGLNRTQIANLAQRFPVETIRQQLSWLPARGARNPAALLIRAIEQEWDEPKDVA